MRTVVRRLGMAFAFTFVAVAGCSSSTAPDRICGESTCIRITEAYISHFTELDCQGQESYYTGYNEFDGIRRSWDGQGLAGTVLRTITHKSFKMGSVCNNAWPTGNTLSDFVRIYR